MVLDVQIAPDKLARYRETKRVKEALNSIALKLGSIDWALRVR